MQRAIDDWCAIKYECKKGSGIKADDKVDKDVIVCLVCIVWYEFLNTSKTLTIKIS